MKTIRRWFEHGHAYPWSMGLIGATLVLLWPSMIGTPQPRAIQVTATIVATLGLALGFLGAWLERPGPRN